MNITLRQLEIFYTVAKLGHVTKSSEVLEISQSGISMSLQELERGLQTKLFERVGRSLVLNENGRALYERAYKVLEDVKCIEDDFINKDYTGHLIIGASQTIASYALPQLMFAFTKEFPEARLELRIGNTEKIGRMVAEGEVDLAFVEGHVMNDLIVIEKWMDDKLCIVTNPATQLKDKDYTIDDLIDKQWIVREKGSGTRQIFEEKALKSGKQLKNTLELGGVEAIKQVLKEQTDVYACVSELAVAEEIKIETLKTVRYKGNLGRELSILTHKNKFHSKLFRKFLEYAKQN